MLLCNILHIPLCFDQSARWWLEEQYHTASQPAHRLRFCVRAHTLQRSAEGSAGAMAAEKDTGGTASPLGATAAFVATNADAVAPASSPPPAPAPAAAPTASFLAFFVFLRRLRRFFAVGGGGGGVAAAVWGPGTGAFVGPAPSSGVSSGDDDGCAPVLSSTGGEGGFDECEGTPSEGPGDGPLSTRVTSSLNTHADPLLSPHLTCTVPNDSSSPATTPGRHSSPTTTLSPMLMPPTASPREDDMAKSTKSPAQLCTDATHCAQSSKRSIIRHAN